MAAELCLLNCAKVGVKCEITNLLCTYNGLVCMNNIIYTKHFVTNISYNV